jgi:altronate dehydratase small subunit
MAATQDKGLKKEYLFLHPADNTATALADLRKGEAIHLEAEGKCLDVTLSEPIPFAHKFALTFIPQGGKVCKYGELIGEASQDIHPGELVHIHNVVSQRSRGQRR